MIANAQSQQPDGSNRDREALILRLVLTVVGPLVLVGVLLFLAAGTLAWDKGWLFLLVFVTAQAIIVLYIVRVNPELLVARTRWRWASRRDLMVSSLTMAALLVIFPVAALDDGRWHWCPQPWWVCCLGYVLFLAGLGVFTWVGTVNKFAEPAVRIQVECGHKVIDTGPYAIVRHPSYAVAAPFFAGIALCLGSLWALIPAGLASAMLVLRTQWEDQTLQAELKGYKEYTERVRYKLIPGVW
jgi:protein-S-isoprenylcysteine O-methyltransferase Ste14